MRASLAGTFEGEDIEALITWTGKLRGEIEKLAGNQPKSVCMLIDLSGLGSYTDNSLLKVLADCIRRDEPLIYRTATWGGSVIHEMAEQIIKVLAGNHELMNFKAEADALRWLSE